MSEARIAISTNAPVIAMNSNTHYALKAAFLYLILLALPARTQNPAIQYDTLYSAVLKEPRPIRIILPKKYIPGPGSKLDVFYVLDGEWNTSLTEKVYEFLEFAKFIPTNLLIVSVPNYYKDGINSRERDFTPTSTENKDGKFTWMRSSLRSGGAAAFLQFMKEELIPYVTKKYPTNPDNNLLYGTSLGGLFAIYAYLQEPAMFKSYLTVEPSLWWDKAYLTKISPERLSTRQGTKNTLWISSRDGEAIREMGIAGFDSVLTRFTPDNLQWKVESYPNETHFSAIWKGLYDGLKYTYVSPKTDGSLVNRANIPDHFRSESGTAISFSRMDAFLKSQMDSLGLPGLSFALINDGEIVYHRTFGLANVDTKQRVSSETLFDAASITKTAFAFLVMRLAEKGVLTLDTPLHTYLPYPDIAYDDRYKLITARMVLSHTTGFPNWRFFNKDGKLDLKFTPGTQFLYSGEGYEYLANVVAHLLKIPKDNLQAVFNTEVAKSLKMKETYFTWTPTVATNRATGHVNGKVVEGYGITSQKPHLFASHSMQTEAVNYAKFLIGLMNGVGLTKESHADMLKAQFLAAFKSTDNQRGLGLVLKSTELGQEYSHNGFNLNFTSEFMFNKDQKFGYVFFTNCNKASDLNKKLVTFLQHK